MKRGLRRELLGVGALGATGEYPHDDGVVDVLSQKATAFIDSSATAGQPFLLEVATFAPHALYTPAPRYATADAGAAYPRTAAYDTLPSAPPSWLQGRGPLTPADQQKIATAWEKRLEADRAVDDLVGNIGNTLRARGIPQNTYLVSSSDNGYHMGEYRLLPGKQTAFYTDLNMPLIVSGPGVPAGRTTDALAANVDLAPTFETLAGARSAGTSTASASPTSGTGGPPAGNRPC
jgi:N-acetylglucosamine-6-sulfatase